MNLFQRFKRYLFGVLLGLILVFFFFGDRADLLTAWMPNERVMKRLRETRLEIPDSVKCRLNCFQLDSATVATLISGDGNVRFAKSETRQVPILYRVDFEKHTSPVRLTFACDDSTSAVVGVLPLEGLQACDCP
jgi:hypothetical protein